MTTHNEMGLVERLRDYAANGRRSWIGIEAIFTEAADTIEALSKPVDAPVVEDGEASSNGDQASSSPVAARSDVPEGWVLVPVEPTEEMIDRFVSRALCVSVHGDGGWSKYAREQWSAMLSAVPALPDLDDRCSRTPDR